MFICVFLDAQYSPVLIYILCTDLHTRVLSSHLSAVLSLPSLLVGLQLNISQDVSTGIFTEM